MSFSRISSTECGRVPAVLSILALLIATSVSPVAAQQPATIQGGIIDPSGNPAEGFITVLTDLATGQEYRSFPSSASGEYSIIVPSGARYQLVSVVAPDGTVLPVQSLPALPVRVAGTYQLDVHFRSVTEATDPGASPGTETTGTASPDEEDDDDDGAALLDKKPWYKKPGGVIGLIVGGGIIIAALGGGGGDDPAESPSTP